MQLHREQEGALVSSTNVYIQGCGRIEQSEICNMADTQNESSRHGREVGKKSPLGGRDG